MVSENVLRSRQTVNSAAEYKRLHIYNATSLKGFMGNAIADDIFKNGIYKKYITKFPKEIGVR